MVITVKVVTSEIALLIHLNYHKMVLGKLFAGTVSYRSVQKMFSGLSQNAQNVKCLCLETD